MKIRHILITCILLAMLAPLVCSCINDDESLSQADYVSKSVQTDCLMEVAAGTADAAADRLCPAHPHRE